MGTDLDRAGSPAADRASDAKPPTPPRDLDRRSWLVGAVGLAALWGVVAGLWTPRGPLTTSEALWSIAISLLVGAAAGYLSDSRWMMILAPLGSAAAFEATRLGTDGPMVDAIHLSTYGVMALVLGRGVHALLMLAPLMTGAAIGAGLARRAGAVRVIGVPPRTGPGVLLRRAVAVLACLALVALTGGLLRPASTEQIPGGVA